MKKVLSIVLSIAMVVCLMPSMAFAATVSTAASSYSDTEGLACEGAVNVLSAFNVVEGYEDGTYKPEQTVTRAEMAALIIRALNVADYASATTSQFNDMSGATWAIPYVEYAANLNIIEGYGNSKFGPSDTVTYEQAATMIVRALGYTDECNEMNGSWPAIYVQKATDLGIFTDVVNGGSTGADRGDIAIMLFNALDLPEVYADNDGATQYKSGSTVFQGTNGNTFKGTSMLATLNKDGSVEYKIVDEDDADNALYNIRSYVGAAGKVYTNKDGDVVSVGDIQTTFLTGTFNSDYDEFTTSDRTYKISSNALKYVSDTDTWETSNASSTYPTSYFENGELTTKDLHGTLSSSNNAELKYNKKTTLAVKTSGTTINQILSVSVWTATESELIDESDISSISNSHRLYGKDFDEDDNGDVDYASFILTGVDSLDDIKEDNVVYIYANGDTIRKIEVGTQTVEGVLESFSEGTLSSGNNNGKTATAVIDGTSYKTSKAMASDAVSNGNNEDIGNWTSADDDDSVDVGDSIKAYLNADGNIFKVELSEAASSAYAMVLDYDIAYSGGKIVNDSGLNGDESKIKVMTADGDDITLSFKNEADVASEVSGVTKVGVGDIITYDLNSSNKVKKITIKQHSSIVDDASDAKGALKANGEPSNITSRGYYDGKQIADNATIFTIDELSGSSSRGSQTAPNYYIDEDDADVASRASLLDTDSVTNYATYTKNNKLAALVINEDATSNTDIFGVITSWSKLSSDDSTGCDYRLSTIVNGTATTYYLDGSIPSNAKMKIFRFDTNASGYITDLIEVADWKSDEGKCLGYAQAGTNGITFNNNVIAGITVDTDAVYYEYDDDDAAFKVSTKSDIRNADASKYAVLLDTNSTDDPDGIADVVLLVSNATQANYNGANITITQVAGTSVSFAINGALTADTAINAISLTTSGATTGYSITSPTVASVVTSSENSTTVNDTLATGNVVTVTVSVAAASGYTLPEGLTTANFSVSGWTVSSYSNGTLTLTYTVA